jgi:hypothetical protein
MAAVDTAQTLAWEARQRRRAALAALAAVLTIVGGFVGAGLAFSGAPSSGVLPALARTIAPGPVGGTRSVRIPYYEFYADRVGSAIATSAVQAMGFLLLGLALTFLAFATRARVPELPRFALLLPLIGGTLTAINYVMAPIGTGHGVNAFLEGPRTLDAVAQIRETTLLRMAGYISVPGTLSLAVGFVLVSLYAMRAGLLTRFMGVLGMLCGALFLLPILPAVQCFWLAALGLLLLGRWPGGDPPAWRTGKREPWPSQQDLREARDRARRPEGPAVAVAAPGPPRPVHPSSKKRKRKRRA